MKLIEALDPIYNLFEGVKFTTAQIEDVKRRAHQIYVSVEYEYYVNEDNVDGDDEEYEGISDAALQRADEQAQEEFNQERDEWIEQVINESNLEEQIEDYYLINKAIFSNSNSLENLYHLIAHGDDDIDEWKEMLDPTNEDYTKNRKEALTAISSLSNIQVSNYFNGVQDFDDVIPYTHHIDNSQIDVDELDKISNFLQEVNEKSHLNINNLKDSEILSNLNFLCEYSEEIDLCNFYLDKVNEITTNPRVFAGQIEDSFRESLEENYEEHRGIDEVDWVSERAHELIDSGAFDDDDNGSKDSGLQFSKNALQNNHNTWGINYDREISVIEPEQRQNQLELKTQQLRIDKALETMAKIFDFIKDVGYTDSSCGMHVNMSFNNERFVPENFDPIKLVMLMGTNETIKRFPVRNYVADILKRVKDDEVLLHLAKCKKVKGGGGDDLLSEFSRMISKGFKFQTINFNHLYSQPQDEKRIEFRYPGGKNYENRLNEFQVELYKQAYMLEAAFNPDFLHNEYLKRVVKVLDQAVYKRKLILVDERDRRNPVIVDKTELTHFVDLQQAVAKYEKIIEQEHADFIELTERTD